MPQVSGRAVHKIDVNGKRYSAYFYGENGTMNDAERHEWHRGQLRAVSVPQRCHKLLAQLERAGLAALRS